MVSAQVSHPHTSRTETRQASKLPSKPKSRSECDVQSNPQSRKRLALVKVSPGVDRSPPRLFAYASALFARKKGQPQDYIDEFLCRHDIRLQYIILLRSCNEKFVQPTPPEAALKIVQTFLDKGNIDMAKQTTLAHLANFPLSYELRFNASVFAIYDNDYHKALEVNQYRHRRRPSRTWRPFEHPLASCSTTPCSVP